MQLRGCRRSQSELHEGSNFLNRAEVNYAPGSYVYTMGILYGRISTWRTEQLLPM